MYKGNYKSIGPDGHYIEYSPGQIVSFEGNLYKCIRTSTKSPFRDKNGWSFIGDSVIYTSSNPPIEPKIGQLWEKNGVVFTYYYDGNNFAWVQF